MKKTIIRLAALMAILGPFPARAVEPIYGVWVRDGHPDEKLEFYDCKGKLCAKGTQPLPDGSAAPEILRKAAKNGDNSWKGDLFNPEDGKTYTGSITYDSTNKLTLSGCLMIFCQSETWTRVSFAKPKPKPETKPETRPSEAKSDAPSEGEKAPEGEAGHGVAGHGSTTAHGAAAPHETGGHEAGSHKVHSPATETAPAHEGAARVTAPHHAAPTAKPKAPAPKPKAAPAPADEQ